MLAPRAGLISLLVLIGWFAAAGAVLASDDDSFEADKIIVKFAAGEQLAATWFKQDRNASLPELEAVIGPHDSRPFLSDAVLTAYSRRIAPAPLAKGSERFSFTPLANIAVLQLGGSSNAESIQFYVDKLNSHDGIEYAERMPRHHFCAGPNDPLAVNQYHLAGIRAFDAWEFIGESRKVLLAIVDTGVEDEHPDLKDVMYINTLEDGPDGRGGDKRTNGIDDDFNGFVDDWRGWDFGSSGDGDNVPLPGSGHGTHVAGIAGAVVNNGLGVSGASPWLEIMPVKVANDSEVNFGVIRGFEGVLYAAAMGAEVINCSWGSVNGSQAESEVIDAVAAMGVVVICGAGNDGRFVNFFPAGYPGSLSVTALSAADKKADFSNFYFTVDVSAPGVDITSTDKNGLFDTRDGTSMSAPMVAAAAALVKTAFPEMDAIQVIEQIKATSKSVDDLNGDVAGLIGRGKLDMYAAVSNREAQSILVEDVRVSDNDGDGLAAPGDEINISIDIWNALAATGAAAAYAGAPVFDDPQLDSYEFELDVLERGEHRDDALTITFTVPQQIVHDYVFRIPIEFRDGENVIGFDAVSIVLNPSYRTLNANNIAVTANSRGNFGYNDYPSNQMGSGFRYKGGRNLMFEGALIIGYSPDHISNVARATTLRRQDDAFLITEAITLTNDGPVAPLEAHCVFGDTLATNDAGVSVQQGIFQFDEEGHRDYTLVRYDVTNTSGVDMEELFIGLLCDWDLQAGGASDVTAFDYNRVLYYVRNVRDESSPLVGMQLLSEYDVNFFAIDNATSRGINLSNGFTREEKWHVISNGVARDRSNVTDVSAVLGAGPISVRAGETVSVAFSIFAGDNFTDLYTHADSARVRAGESGIGTAAIKRLPRESHLTSVFPNPDRNGVVTVDYQLAVKQAVSIDVFDLLGRRMMQVFHGEQRVGQYSVEILTASLPVGNYVVRLQLQDMVETFALKVLR